MNDERGETKTVPTICIQRQGRSEEGGSEGETEAKKEARREGGGSEEGARRERGKAKTSTLNRSRIVCVIMRTNRNNTRDFNIRYCIV